MSADTITVTWTEAMHEVAELERDAAWCAGYQAGRADRQADIEQWCESFCASAPGARHAPVSEAAVRVVRELVNRIVAESRPLNTAPPGNHPGGPVPPWGDA